MPPTPTHVRYIPTHVQHRNYLKILLPSRVGATLCLFVPTYTIISCITTNTNAIVLAAWKFFSICLNSAELSCSEGNSRMM